MDKVQEASSPPPPYSDEQTDPRYKVPSRYKDVEMGECTGKEATSVR